MAGKQQCKFQLGKMQTGEKQLELEYAAGINRVEEMEE